MATEPNVLYYGDNLDILRRYVKDESVDLIYLDPPFKSNQDYNVLFAERDGMQAAAQIKAFEDTWHWDMSAAEAFDDVIRQGGKVAQVMIAFRTFLGENDMLAYLAMMAPRLVEMRRALKPRGSIYLHCDPTASHYLKMLMDAVFGARNFRNEIIWKRTSARSDSHRWNHIHDVILFYSKTADFVWNTQFMPYSLEYQEKFYHFVEPETGRRYASDNLTASGTREGSSGDTWRGIDVKTKGIHWKYKIETLEKMDREGRIIYPKKAGGVPRYKRYLDEMPGLAIQSIVTDIPPLSAASAEKLGYPTQKPQALLERIINSSSNPGGIVLDPFCGCGTTVSAAQALVRSWIGIDITHLAINLIKIRMRNSFGEVAKFKVIGEPVSVSDAEELAKSDPYQFQWWALGLVGARPVEGKKGADKGIDGRIYFHDEPKGSTKQIVISVKAGKLHAHYVRDIRGVMDREKAEISVLISMDDPSKQMRTEAASAGFYESPYGKKYPRLQLLTVGDLLAGKDIDYPPSSHKQDVTFKQAPKVKGRKEADPRLPFDTANE